ncbi:23975_t:CDS:2, partial [Cetraspora pellucida]
YRQQVDERMFAQLKHLYLMLKRLEESTNKIKARLGRLERHQEEQENDLSAQVIDYDLSPQYEPEAGSSSFQQSSQHQTELSQEDADDLFGCND